MPKNSGGKSARKDRPKGKTTSKTVSVGPGSNISPIAAYKAARAGLDQAWRERCQAEGWGKGEGIGDADSFSFLREVCANADRETALEAEHFPGLNLLDPRTVDTLPKLWAFIVRGIATSALAEPMPGFEGYGPMLREVYAALHRLNVAWAPEPPYEPVPDNQVKDRLLYIANRLEREDGPATGNPRNGTTDQLPAGDNQLAMRSLLGVFTNGVADQRICRAASVLQDTLRHCQGHRHRRGNSMPIHVCGTRLADEDVGHARGLSGIEHYDTEAKGKITHGKHFM